MPLLVWAYQTLESRPIFYLLECTPGLDLDFLQTIHAGMFLLHSMFLDPIAFAVPVSGKRVFGLGQRLDCIVLPVPWSLETLQDLAFKRLKLTSAVFLLASKSEVQDFLNRLAFNFHGVAPHPGGKCFFARDCIDAGHRGRLEDHETQAQAWRRTTTEARPFYFAWMFDRMIFVSFPM